MKKLPPAPREVQQLLRERGIVRGYAWWHCRAHRRGSGASSGRSSLRLFYVVTASRLLAVPLPELDWEIRAEDRLRPPRTSTLRRDARKRWQQDGSFFRAVAIAGTGTRVTGEKREPICLLGIVGERDLRAAVELSNRHRHIATSRAHFSHWHFFLAFALPE